MDRLSQALAGRYTLLRELGSGGMATVYLADDVKHRRKVAVKVLRPDLAATLGPERFLREIEIAAGLSHPHILPLLDSGDADGFLYYVMPYVDGESLRARIAREGELPAPEAARLLAEVTDALAYAHARGVVHRDIKPDNVMLSGRHALVMDFGVAKAVSEATGRQTLTTAGVALGTPSYMSPEQCAADPHIDHRADIYAVGAMGYELLAGRPPFVGATPQAVLAAHVTQPAEPVGRLRTGLPAVLEATIMRCLAKRPADRFQSADELRAQLEPLATPSGGLTPTGLLPVVAPPGRRARVALVGLGVVVLAGLAAAASLLLRRPPAVLSLGRATQVTFDPGLEIDPALSPDGKFVAYVAGPEQALQLYVRQVGGGSPVRVVDEPGANHHLPRWSPDGSELLYNTDDGIFVVPALGGTPRQAVAGGLVGPSGFSAPMAHSAVWSGDGRRIYYVGRDTIYERTLGRAAPRAVAAAKAAYDLALSPDGKLLAYAAGNPFFVISGSAFGNIAPSDVWVVPVGGGEATRVSGGSGMNLSPAWLAGGGLLYISNRDGTRDLYLQRLGRGGRPDGAAARLSSGLNAGAVSVSADGHRIAYSVYTSTSNIWSLPIEAHALSVSQAQPVTKGNQSIESLATSLDGAWLAFDANRTGNSDIYRMRLPDGEPERLTDDPADDFAPAYSPDGRWIAFHSFRNGTRDIFVMPAAGGPATAVTNSPRQEQNAFWTPDGASLVYFVSSEGGIEVVTRGTAGWGTPRPLARVDGALCGVDRSGSLVAPTADSVWAVPLDGGPARTLPITAGRGEPHSCALSPDGRTLYVRRAEPHGGGAIWAAPVVGGQGHMIVSFDDPSRQSARGVFAVSASRVYFTLDDRQSDVWVAELGATR